MSPEKQRELRERIDNLSAEDRRMFDAMKKGFQDYAAERRWHDLQRQDHAPERACGGDSGWYDLPDRFREHG